MSDQKKTQLRLLLADRKLIIVDKISMVGNTALLHIHQRLSFVYVFQGKTWGNLAIYTQITGRQKWHRRIRFFRIENKV